MSLDNVFNVRFREALLLAFCGGSMEAYTFVVCNGFFANAQTGNFARFGIFLAQGSINAALCSLIPIITFMFGIIAVSAAKDKLARLENGSFHKCAILMAEAFLLLILGFVPSGKYSLFVSSVISFISAIQIETFLRFEGFAFASTMCTGNLRKGTEWIVEKAFQKKAPVNTGIKYYLIDFSFAAGALVGYIISRELGCYASHFISVCLLIIAASIALQH